MDTMEFSATIGSRPTKVTGNSVQELHERWMKHIKTLGHTDEQSDYWLNRIKSSSIKYDREKIEKRKTLKISEMWHAGVALFKQGAGETVNQEENDRRSKICRNCPFKDTVSNCIPCGGGDKLTGLINGFRRKFRVVLRIDREIKNKYCKACGCSLTLLCLTKKEFLPKETPEENRARPIRCWMRKDSPNFQP